MRVAEAGDYWVGHGWGSRRKLSSTVLPQSIKQWYGRLPSISTANATISCGALIVREHDHKWSYPPSKRLPAKEEILLEL